MQILDSSIIIWTVANFDDRLNSSMLASSPTPSTLQQSLCIFKDTVSEY